MKAVFGLITIFTLIAVLNAADECHVHGHKVGLGEVYNPIGKCATYTCHEDGTYSGKLCPSVAIGPNCILTKEDVTKPYPECCPDPVCT